MRILSGLIRTGASLARQQVAIANRCSRLLGCDKQRCALGLFAGHVIATRAAKYPHLRMLLNTRQLAHKRHRQVAMLASRSWDLAGGGRWDFAGGGWRHESTIRSSKRGTAMTTSALVSAPELVKIVRPLWPIWTTGLGARPLWSMTRGQ
jgi:hypothetical protein